MCDLQYKIYRLDKTNIIHLGFGKVSFGTDKLLENYETIIGAIIKAKPAAAKGQYIKSVAISTTMGPSMYIDQKQKIDLLPKKVSNLVSLTEAKKERILKSNQSLS